jgi:hypothetical protein
MQEQLTVRDILHGYGQGYIRANNVTGQAKGLVHLLSSCRTGALGSHYQQCDSCRYLGKAYNSCRNRHCPLCQQKDKAQWLEKRMKELLPVGYYHLVFTIPHQLNPLCRQNKKVMYDLLFKAASQTVLELARDTRHLGADVGLVTVLHTWGQNLMEHPHLHCIMPAGGLSSDRGHWVHPQKKNNFLVHYKVVSKKFRGKFLALLQQASDKGQLVFKGRAATLKPKKQFAAFKDSLYNMKWVVNIQPPFGSPEKVLGYLSRYVFRVAITDRRILEVKDGKVLFSWKDYRTGRFRKMRLDVDEFIRRFLLHILPQGFFKVRYYGIFSNRYRSENLAKARELLAQEKLDSQQEALEDGRAVWVKQQTPWEEFHHLVQTYQTANCPHCGKGRLRFAGLVQKERFVPG